MKARMFLATGAMLLSMAALGNAKSWDIYVNSSTKAGSMMLPAGNYHVKLDKNSQAIFTEANSGKEYSVAVKVEQAPKKFDSTAVESQKHGDSDVIQAIDLGGTTQKLEFGE